MKKYENSDWLKKQYVDNRKSIRDIAEMCDVSTYPIQKRLEKFGIERRPSNDKKLLSLKDRPDGYVEFGGEGEKMLHHRLLAVAEYGIEAVCGNDIHHINGIEWDNRPENIEVKNKEDHGRMHANERWNN